MSYLDHQGEGGCVFFCCFQVLACFGRVGGALASDLLRKLAKTFENMRTLMPQKLIYVALQATWKLLTNRPVKRDPMGLLLMGSRVPFGGRGEEGVVGCRLLVVGCWLLVVGCLKKSSEPVLV